MFERQFTDQTFDEIIEAATESRDFVCSGFCRRLLNGVEAHAEEIDTAIEANCRGWNLAPFVQSGAGRSASGCL